MKQSQGEHDKLVLSLFHLRQLQAFHNDHPGAQQNAVGPSAPFVGVYGHGIYSHQLHAIGREPSGGIFRQGDEVFLKRAVRGLL